MFNVLRVDASPRQARSLSRSLADAFVNELKLHCQTHLQERDLRSSKLSFVDEDWIAAAFTPEEERTSAQRSALALSDALIEELAACDLLVISTPMYNYGMPAVLKAWVDQVVRVNKTFTFDLARGDFPLEPVLSGKQMVLLTACGEFGFKPGGVREGQDHLLPHMETVAKYLGVDAIEHIGIEYQEFGDERHAASKAEAHEAARALARRIASERVGQVATV